MGPGRGVDFKRKDDAGPDITSLEVFHVLRD